jgi:DNA-3-methyladenine glycosylase I
MAYHDEEWGRPSRDERHLFELLTLEAFQSGLSWLTILRKREGFRAAFDGWDVERVAAYGDRDVERLLGDPGIVRHRGKVEATLANARAVLALGAERLTLAGLLWRFAPEPGPAPRSRAELPTTTPTSAALSKELRRRGFRFVGPTVAYSLMQAAGLVDDHLAGCEFRPPS